MKTDKGSEKRYEVGVYVKNPTGRFYGRLIKKYKSQTYDKAMKIFDELCNQDYSQQTHIEVASDDGTEELYICRLNPK